jgi:hypothetical protein
MAGGVRWPGKSDCGGGSRHLLAEEAVEAWPAWQRRGGALGQSSGSGVQRLALARREEEQRRGVSGRRRRKKGGAPSGVRSS